MAQVINTNSLSLLTQNNLNKSQSALGSAIERLSSGLRINSAKDDAAGQAIANRFTANIKGLTQASRNANDGISVAQTTEGALSEINNNLQRVRELSVQAANGSNSGSDLKSIQDEIDQRLAEINRVSEQTDFNGKKVLNQNSQLTIQVGAKDGETITIDLKKIDSTTLGLENFDISKVATPVTTAKGALPIANATFTASGGTPGTAATTLYEDDKGGMWAVGGTDYYKATVDSKTGTVNYDVNSKSTKAAVDTAAGGTAGNPVTTIDTEFAVDTKAGEKILSYQDPAAPGTTKYIGQDDKGNFFDVKFDNATKKVSVDTTKAATAPAGITANPLAKVDDALKMVDEFRSSLGAVQNRFESAVTNLGNTVNNLSSARSRIEDSDYATEVSNMSRAQILQQAGTSVLAQANQTTQNVLSLLR
ncbi:FliC/FljB family flagellin [Citrobacter portucalensis]|uniref:FliC/FljB family flagellin n=1 Tax=Citrobacter portucalensis TaxID=1639133 RepID=UPI002244DF7D|nr:FliC/FljB family flagellin [Citrobacter portucalensis]MCW8352628.1 FliC/FljB family flagellin [Citrobacter portucalensis]MCX8994600.1 FliC/FljB family flagellin [Citrobacter portucalensis]MCX9018344.1 FliC/FljB family flagellin [Citrobacter portucalensis]MCX9042476.1 FliC/FljB family flagellin [Citrobacter portucalensis]MCX9051514.1 FliC/FljB family flagellin [Citrobacter portucalensis]